MESSNAIEVKNITKKFKIYFDKGSSLKEKMLFKRRNHYEERLVLRGISFDIKKGEAVGLIGKNGCGKSTTLKMLTRIMYPDSGSIVVKGRVSSLIELGAGFHPDMSGRENIYTNAAIFGLTRKEIDHRINDIIEFSEMDDFLDNPVRTYSSGMYMRLAFAVAINVDADVLLIDEILGVGDVSFQTKCFEKLKEIKKNGTTIVIVSHSLEQISRICERSIWIEDGEIKEEGIPEIVHRHYLTQMEEIRLQKKETDREKNGIVEDELPDMPAGCYDQAVRTGNQSVRISKVEITGENLKRGNLLPIRNSFEISVSYDTDISVAGKISISILRDDNTLYCYSDTFIDTQKYITFDSAGDVKLKVDGHYLAVGNYIVHIVILDSENFVIDSLQHALDFRVMPDENGYETIPMEHRWILEHAKIEEE
ncbi:MAG: ABC transporter ATP-binding protein [Hungatella sp.]|jgi:ABC-2 type transport system ATP-binding protein|nr:ABC transporter ATP-binding protein [Hungatella sp.]